MPRVSLVIPAFNEAERLPPFLESIARFHRASPTHLLEVLVVDDGSSDETQHVASQLQSDLPILKVVSHGKNQGKGAAVQTGVMQAQGDQIVFMDADGATEIDELPRMIAALSEADIAVGNRWMKGADTERASILRQLSGFVYRSYMKLFGLGAVDTMCGFKGYQAAVARDLFSGLQEKRWLFDTEVAYKAVQKKYRVKNFPIRWRSMDGSKLDTRTLLKTAFQIWPLIRSLNKGS